MIKWSKRDEDRRTFAYVNGRCIGGIKPLIATQFPTYEWEIVSLGNDPIFERQGCCLTERGAKKALERNWQKFCERFGLIAKNREDRPKPKRDKTQVEYRHSLTGFSKNINV